MKQAFILTVVLLITSTGISAFDTVATEAEKSSTALSGYARASAWGGGSAFPMTSLFAEISLQSEITFSKVYAETDIRLRKGYSFGEEEQLIDINKLVVGYSGKLADIRLGYQDVAWGRTDGFNPTNYLQSYNYFYLTAEPDDQSDPNLALRTRFRLSAYTELDLAVMPFYLPSVYRYELFDLGENVTFTEPHFPEPTLDNGSIAARLNFDFPAVGASVSAFRGYDPYHGFRVKDIDWATGTPRITNQAASYQKTSVGADLAIPLPNIIIKAEAAWNSTDNPENAMHIPNSYWMYVGGIEANPGSTTLIVNYIGYCNPNFTSLQAPQPNDPMNPMPQPAYAMALIDYENRLFNRRIFHQQEKFNHAASLSLLRNFGYDAWQAQLTAYYDITSGELMIRPVLKWNVNDQLSLTAGGNYMYGKSGTLFDYSSSVMNGAFLEFRVKF